MEGYLGDGKWKAIGELLSGDVVYRHADSGAVAVEKDHMYLCDPTEIELRGIEQLRA